MDDDRAVSPVIGVILMVAITVILAAVIGTFVLGLGENVSESTPQAQLTMDADTNNITINHKGGDAIPSSEIKITVSNESSGEIATFSPNSNETEELTVGDSGTLYMSDTNASLYWPDKVSTGTASQSGTTLTTGVPYTVQIVHTASDQLIMDRTVRP